MKLLCKYLFLFMIGGGIYSLIEIGYRGHTHWTMFIVGGVCFILLGLINELIPWDLPMVCQMLMGGALITGVEFITGVIVNLILGWEVWDYSHMPLNILGQICLPFSLLWCLVSAVGIVLDDYIRYRLFGEEKPEYTLFI